MCTVVVYDDDPDVVARVVEPVSEAGYTIVQAQSGEEATRLTLENDYEILILGETIPREDTQTLMRDFISKSQGRTGLVLMMFMTNEKDGVFGWPADIDIHTYKTFNPRELVYFVNLVCDEKQKKRAAIQGA